MSFASMPSRGEVVLVTTNNRTWTWDGVDWTDHGPLPFSSIRDFALQYLPERDRVVLHGGRDYSQITPQLQNAVWEWNGTSWQQVTSQNSPLRAFHRLVEGPGQLLYVLPASPNPLDRLGSVTPSTSAALPAAIGKRATPALRARPCRSPP